MTLVLYDGVCALCNRLNRFLLPRDRQARLRFAPLQSDLARGILRRYGHPTDDLDTVYVVANWQTANERVLSRSRAVLHAARQLGGVWPVLARVAGIVPVSIADALYLVVARTRYHVFGKYDVCPIPLPEWRDRFVDQSDSERSRGG